MRPFVHGHDPVGYYSWLRSAVCDHDLDVTNEFEHFLSPETAASKTFKQTTPNGYRHNQWPAGSALLWSPLYLLTHASLILAHASGLAAKPDCYGLAYEFAASLNSSLYGLGSVLLCYRMARHFFGQFSALVAASVIWFATPLVFYTFSNPLMAHTTDTFVCTLFIFVWWHTDQKPSWRGGLLVGLVLGLATWVRTQNALFLAAPGLLAGFDLVQAIRQGQAAHAQTIILRGLAILAGFASVFSLLMLFWHHLYGTWIVNTYAYAGVKWNRFDWSAPHMLDVFISSDRGMFVWSPILLFALIGVWWLRSVQPRLTIFMSILFLIQLYVVSSWWFWSGAVAFGPRFWTNMVALFTLGLAALLAHMPQQVPRRALIVAGGGFVLWNLLLIVQYALETIPRSGPVDIGKMVKYQFLIVPQNLERIIQSLLERN
jgi:hypothetical protein